MKKHIILALFTFIGICLAVSCKDDPDIVLSSVDANPKTLEISPEGGNHTIKLYSNREWTATTSLTEADDKWFTVTPDSGSASEDSISITISALENKGKDRSASVTFSIGQYSTKVDIKQTGSQESIYTPISDVRALLKDGGTPVTITQNWTISGTVISDYRKDTSGGLNNATSAKSVVISDGEAGIQLYLTADNTTLAPGDVVTINVKGMELQRYNSGSMQLNAVPVEKVIKIGEDAPIEAKTIMAADLLTGKYESMYVAIPDVQSESTDAQTFVKGGAHTSVNFISKTGEKFVIFSSKYSTFGDKTVPTGSGTLKGIAMVYGNTYQISLAKADDIAGLTGARFNVSVDVKPQTVGDYAKWSAITPTSAWSENFSSITSGYKPYANDHWMFYTTDGTNADCGWKTGIYNATKYIDIAPYNTTLDQVVAYALLPKVNVKGATSKSLKYKAALYYKSSPDNSKLEIVTSSDFAGDFAAATWTVLKDVSFPSGAEINNWTDFEVDLSSFASNESLTIAFRYTGKNNTYRLDDVVVGDGVIEKERLKSDKVSQWMELPTVDTTETVAYVYHRTSVAGADVRNYSMLFDADNKVALWIAYPLCSSYIGGSGRSDAWGYDPKIPAELQPTLSSGWGVSGYDRGHQLPSGDRTSSRETNAQTFYYTNMTAQKSEFNQQIWGNLENKVRQTYMKSCDTVYVVTGPVLKLSETDEIEYIKDNSNVDVAIPKAYFKVLLKYTKSSNTYESIGFWYENKGYSHSSPKASDALSVADIEKKTGYKFFVNLPDNIESTVKSQCEPSKWDLQ